ncbi:MAG: S41 family peptidase [Planctomycetota bacterium]
MPPRNFNVILFAIATGLLCHVTYRNMRTASILGEAIELIESNYVDPVERRELVMAAMKGVVQQLDDNSSYFTVDAYESFQDSMHQEFAGIGIYVEQPDETKPVRVVTPLVDSPALSAGLLPGDEILIVDGVDVSQMKLADVSKRLKGPEGTIVSLQVGRQDQRIDIQLQRDMIELESVIGDHRDANNQWVYRLKSEPSVAYIRMKSFGEKTVRELRDVLVDLDSNFSALVLDLRSNGGGLLYAARDVADMFISQGKIVDTRVRGGKMESELTATPGTLVRPDIPMAVIIDGSSASASEIVAACLQDNERALIVGERSYGKGTVQEIMPLEYGRSALRLTVARYFRPSNKNIHRDRDATEDDEWGVTPDEGFRIPMDLASLITLSNRWQKSSFPALAGIDPPESPLAVVSEQAGPVQAGPVQAGPDQAGPEQNKDGEQTTPAVTAEPSDKTIAKPSAKPSQAAEENIQRGPAALADDPPLRAAVGHLLAKIKPSP